MRAVCPLAPLDLMSQSSYRCRVRRLPSKAKVGQFRPIPDRFMPQGESNPEIRFVLLETASARCRQKSFLSASVASRLVWVPDFTFTENFGFERV